MEYKTFEEWFKESGHSDEFRLILEIGWNAGVSESCSLFGDIEGWDYDVEKTLLTPSTNLQE